MSEQAAVLDGRALALAVVYHWLSTGFRPPEASVLAELDRLGQGLDLALEAIGLPASAERMETLRALDDQQALDKDWYDLFGHTVNGDCPPYELQYADTEELLQQPHQLSDLAGIYQAFELTLTNGLGERQDFVAVEFEFLAFLSRKEAYGLEQADEQLIESTREGQVCFLRYHPGRWIPAFTHRMARAARTPFYRELAALTREVIEGDCARHDVLPGLETLPLQIPVDGPEDCNACPFADGQTQEGPLV